MCESRAATGAGRMKFLLGIIGARFPEAGRRPDRAGQGSEGILIADLSALCLVRIGERLLGFFDLFFRSCFPGVFRFRELAAVFFQGQFGLSDGRLSFAWMAARRVLSATA